MNLQKQITQAPVRTIQIFISLVAIIATTGSLYLSLGLGLVPCELCWYQRILMYPLVPISIYSLYKKELFSPLILTLSSIGMIISYYHSFIQLAPDKSVCSSICSAVLYSVGPFTIPNLSAIAFTLISASVVVGYYFQTN